MRRRVGERRLRRHRTEVERPVVVEVPLVQHDRTVGVGRATAIEADRLASRARIRPARVGHRRFRSRHDRHRRRRRVDQAVIVGHAQDHVACMRRRVGERRLRRRRTEVERSVVVEVPFVQHDRTVGVERVAAVKAHRHAHSAHIRPARVGHRGKRLICDEEDMIDHDPSVIFPEAEQVEVQRSHCPVSHTCKIHFHPNWLRQRQHVPGRVESGDRHERTGERLARGLDVQERVGSDDPFGLADQRYERVGVQQSGFERIGRTALATAEIDPEDREQQRLCARGHDKRLAQSAEVRAALPQDALGVLDAGRTANVPAERRIGRIGHAKVAVDEVFGRIAGASQWVARGRRFGHRA